MRGILILIFLALAGLIGWAVLAPSEVAPRAVSLPENPGLTGVFAENASLSEAQLLDVGGEGPEDVAIGPDGRLYTGLSDGRIMSMAPDGSDLRTVGSTLGRPLGLQFDTAGNLIVADAYKGLLSVDVETGEVIVLTDSVNGEKMIFVDDLDIASDGTIWFSDASTEFGYDGTVASFFARDGTGRLLSYDPVTGETQVHVDGLLFANGVALGPDEAYLLVNETHAYRIARYWLKGPYAGMTDMFLENLPALPDNLSFDGERFWIAMVSPREAVHDLFNEQPDFRRALYNVSTLMEPPIASHGLVAGVTPEGEVDTVLHSPDGKVFATTSVNAADGWLYVGSLTAPHVARLRLPD